MYSELDGEIRTIRVRRNVAWCGFCDRSRMFDGTWDLASGVGCDGCGAVFKDVVIEEVATEDEPAPRRRRRATVTQEEADAEIVAEEDGE